MPLPYDEVLKKAQGTIEKITVEMPPEKEPKFPEKKKNPVGRPKKVKQNQLVKIPQIVDTSLEGKISEDELDPTYPVHILVEKFRNGDVDFTDLTVDDRFTMIRHLKEKESKNKHEIAEELGVTVQTVTNYFKKIKELNAQVLADEDIWKMGGEIYSQGIRAMEAAINKGKVKDWAYVLTSMISTLQSLGLVFKMPKQSMVSQQIQHNMAEKKGHEGFKQIKHIAENEEINLESVFNELMGAVNDGKLDKE